MDMTMFLAQVWGPILLAFALGLFTNRSYYLRVYSDLQKEPLALLTFGMFAMGLGIAQIYFHNGWNTAAQILVSLMGWGLMLKGALFLIVPSFVDYMGDWQVNAKLVPFAGILTIVVGGYLTYVGYFA